MKSSQLNNKWILLYYFILLCIVVFRTSATEPSVVVRYGFLTAFFAPLVLKYRYLFPVCLITFMTIGTYGFAYNFFPYNMGMYVIIALIGLLFVLKSIHFSVSAIFIACLIYTSIINLINSSYLPSCVLSLATTILLSYYLSNNRSFNCKALLNGFCVASTALSFIYLLNYEKFLVSYWGNTLERSGWTDPNYLSCVIGMGVVSAIYLLITVKSNLYLKLFWILTIALSFFSQVMMASRGGLLAVSISGMILIFMTNTKLKYKLAIVLGITIFILWLYNNNYFELFQYRIEHDDGSGSGRLNIWMRRFNDFSTFNTLPMLFGVGYDRSLTMGGDVAAFGFHNDFIAILCQYGIIGFITFIVLLIKPILGLRKDGRFPVAAFITYTIISSMTLEPFTAGRLTYFGFFLMIVVLANMYKKIPSLKL